MKSILITGATGGLGKAFTSYYDKDKNHLYLHGTSLDKLTKLKESLHCEVTLLPSDFSDINQLHDFIKQIEPLHFDLVINNAGIGHYGPFDEMEIDQIETMIDLNLKALTLIAHTVLQDMKSRRSGYLLNVGSVASYFPGPLMAQYYATKAYVLSLSSALHEEAKDYQVVVSCLCPGPTKTEFHDRAHIATGSVLSSLFNGKPERVVQVGIRDLMKKKRVSLPGVGPKLSVFFSKLIPDGLFVSIMKNIQQKR
jgi:short-subunit dehydrogenase